MSVVAAAHIKGVVSMEPVVRLRNGTVVRMGSVSNVPVLRVYQQWRQDRRIGDFREARGLNRDARINGPLALPKNAAHRWWVLRRIARNQKLFGV